MPHGSTFPFLPLDVIQILDPLHFDFPADRTLQHHPDGWL